MKIRFQADADLNERIISGVVRRAPEIDFRTSTSAGLRGLHDLEVLELAARENRLLVTHDWETVPHHFGKFILDRRSAGVLVIPQQLGIGHAIEEIIMIWHVSEAEEYINSIRRIPM